MSNTLFEQFSGTYTKQGDYLLPNLVLPAEAENGYIGVWGTTQVKLLKAPSEIIEYYRLCKSIHLSP